MATSCRNLGQFQPKKVGKAQYMLPEKYDDLSVTGSGAFGFVIRAKDTKTNKLVAIKKLQRPFDTEDYAKRTYRELRLLMYLNHPDAHVVQLYDVFTPDPSSNNFKTLCFVFNYVDYDLDNIIKNYDKLDEDRIKLYIYSILLGLKFIHSAGIIHRDLKPANIGVDRNSNITILDFGLARTDTKNSFTEYVVTRWWRAPEVYQDEKHYSKKIDVWSVGCIMAELIRREPIFQGSDYIDQLDKILDIIGTPTETVINDICTPGAREQINKKPHKQKKDFQELFRHICHPKTKEPITTISPEGINLLEQLLDFDYRKRPTVEEAIAHPFLAKYRVAKEEFITIPFVDEHEDKNYNIGEWKSLIYNMVQEFQPPKWATENSVDDDDDEDSSTEDETE